MSTDFKDIVNDPNYSTEATSASKATIFVFIGTFIFELFSIDSSVGLIGGAIFLLVGLFVVSIAISMPLFIMKKKYTKVTLIFDVLGFIITVFVTSVLFQLFFI